MSDAPMQQRHPADGQLQEGETEARWIQGSLIRRYEQALANEAALTARVAALENALREGRDVLGELYYVEHNVVAPARARAAHDRAFAFLERDGIDALLEPKP